MIVDLTDEQARRTLPLKWGQAPPGVLPAWVAEMDYALAPPVHEAVTRAVADGVTGLPRLGPRGRPRRSPGSRSGSGAGTSTPRGWCSSAT